MSRRDWTIFMFSLILSNAYWTLACFMGISLFEESISGIVSDSKEIFSLIEKPSGNIALLA